MNTTDFDKLLEPYAGRVTKQDAVLAMILAKLNTLTTVVLNSRYEKGSEEMRKAFELEQETFAEHLKVQLDLMAELK